MKRAIITIVGLLLIAGAAEAQCVKALTPQLFDPTGPLPLQVVSPGEPGVIIALPATTGQYTVQWSKSADYAGALRQFHAGTVQNTVPYTQVEVAGCVDN